MISPTRLAKSPLRTWAIFLTIGLSICAGLSFTLRDGYAPVVTLHDLRNTDVVQAFRVVQLSDLHLQRFDVDEKIIVSKVIALKPDLVVLSGDAIDRPDALPALRLFLTALAEVSVVAVPGNWEHWSGVDLKALNDLMLEHPAGRFLLNQRHSFTSNGRNVTVIGLDDYTGGNPDAQLLSDGALDGTNILVQHSPGFFDESDVIRKMGSHKFSICLSGHTHGGQIVFAEWAPFRPIGSGRFVAGFYDIPGCRLYVSRGLGTSVIPIRWGAAPEIAVFDL